MRSPRSSSLSALSERQHADALPQVQPAGFQLADQG